MKQSIEERRLHHQTRADRQRNAYNYLLKRIADIKAGRGRYQVKLPIYERDVVRLGNKLGIA